MEPLDACEDPTIIRDEVKRSVDEGSRRSSGSKRI